MDKYCVRDVLSAFMLRCYGFEGPLYERDSLLVLSSHVLLTAASTALPEGALKGLESYVAPAYGPYCLEAVRTWDQAVDTQASSEDLFEICRLVEDARGLFVRFEALPIDALASLDVSRASMRLCSRSCSARLPRVQTVLRTHAPLWRVAAT